MIMCTCGAGGGINEVLKSLMACGNNLFVKLAMFIWIDLNMLPDGNNCNRWCAGCDVSLRAWRVQCRKRDKEGVDVWQVYTDDSFSSSNHMLYAHLFCFDAVGKPHSLTAQHSTAQQLKFTNIRSDRFS